MEMERPLHAPFSGSFPRARGPLPRSLRADCGRHGAASSYSVIRDFFYPAGWKAAGKRFSGPVLFAGHILRVSGSLGKFLFHYGDLQHRRVRRDDAAVSLGNVPALVCAPSDPWDSVFSGDQRHSGNWLL